MNIVALREAKAKLTEVGRAVQRGSSTLITRRGKPVVVFVGVEGEELIDVLLRWDPAFWRDLERRRARSQATSVSLEELEQTALSPRKSRDSTPPRTREKRPQRNGRRLHRRGP